MSNNKQEEKKTVIFEKNCKIVIGGEIKSFKKDSKKSLSKDLANKLIKNKVAKEYVDIAKKN